MRRADLGRGDAAWLPGDRPFSRLYFGVETCFFLLPDGDGVEHAALACRERGLGLTLLTPPATEDALLPILSRVEAAVAAGAPDLEVVVNDWGVLLLLVSRALPVRLLLGRLLNKVLRDPRLPDVGPEHLGRDALPASWRACAAGSWRFRAFLAESGIGRVESDVPMQGLEPLPPSGPAVSAWLPFGIAATGRICLPHGLHRRPAERFVPPLACGAPCRGWELDLRAPWPRRGGGDAEGPRFLSAGNAHFYLLDGQRIEAALLWAQASPAVDRLVVQPWLPV